MKKFSVLVALAILINNLAGKNSTISKIFPLKEGKIYYAEVVKNIWI